MSSSPGRVVEESLATNLLRWTLDHPDKRNAVTPAMLAWITRRCAELTGEVVVIRGGSARAFCSGFDLTALAELRATNDLPDTVLIEATQAMTRADATFVAAVAGAAVGAGVELAATCDLVVVATDATFAVPAGRVGVVYHAAGLRRIRQRLGARATSRMLLCGATLSTSELDGAFEAVVPVAELDHVAMQMAHAVLALSSASVRGNRDFLRALERDEVTAITVEQHETRRRAAYTGRNLPDQ